ncbi:MAG: CoA activase [Deltaproteobacteria bacterium]|nr:MAG: CoA activase [Desulfococcus sp. 4484_242]RLC31089.1 MAG: CoA activase [Deltaproteobacteria bacterium]
MNPETVVDFQSLSKNVGRFALKEKTVLIPEMARIGSHLIAATFRGFGIHAKVMDTCTGLDLGKQYTSGKECYPCQITIGDILHFLEKEREKQGKAFDPENYIYFMPEAEGPCRFGMYNKYQRIVLDSFPDFKQVRIGSISTDDGYSLAGMIDKERVRDLRKSAFFCVVVSDVLDRLLWRVRPYEREPGMADDMIDRAMHTMEAAFETWAADKNYVKILDILEEIIEQGKAVIDRKIPPKPLIGIVGEIYLRSHTQANQDLIRVLEKHGAEVVNASVAEWVNFTTYQGLRDARKKLRFNLKRFRPAAVRENLDRILRFGGELEYQQFRQRQVYHRAKSILNISEDHSVPHLEDVLKEDDLYGFDVGTEACLSIAGIKEYAREGYNGIVNVYPFTCMPSTITSAIVKPLMNSLRIPYLDTPYDAGFQPGRETAIRTFMYQAHQHFSRHGRKTH